MFFDRKYYPNITCPYCRYRHPKEWSCLFAKTVAKYEKDKEYNKENAMLTEKRIEEMFRKWFDPDDGGNYLDYWKACAHAIETEVTKCTPSSLSWSGNNVHGDIGSIKAIRDAVNYSDQVPKLKDIIKDLQDKIAEQVALIEQCEEALKSCVNKKGKNGDNLTYYIQEFDKTVVAEAFTAIAKYKKG